MRGLMTRSERFGIAQYIPASVKAMSKTSVVLFMGEITCRRFRAAAKYMPLSAPLRLQAVDIRQFFEF